MFIDKNLSGFRFPPIHIVKVPNQCFLAVHGHTDQRRPFMPAYRLHTPDGTEHIMIIRGEDEENYSIETIHRFCGYEIRTRRLYNKCVFEELQSLGLIIPLVS